jgi:hypothetical protein
LGLSQKEYLSLTPRLFQFRCEAWQEEQKRKKQEIKALAYYVGACARSILAEEYPRFEEMFPEPVEEEQEETNPKCDLKERENNLKERLRFDGMRMP